MRKISFSEVIADVTSRFKKIKQSGYQKNGLFQIIDQGKEYIAGYTDDTSLVNGKLSPIIIFGDHTRVFKYVETPIALGADGAKALWVNPEIANSRYVFFYLKSLKLKDAGYSRHFKFLKELKIPIPHKDGKPAIDDQIRIATLLSRVEALIATRKDNLRLLDEFLKSTFLEMFGDETGYPKHKTSNVCTKITDGTHQSPNFIDEGIPFLLVSNIVNNKITYETKKFISEDDYLTLTKNTPIEIGDVLLTTVGSYGNPAIVLENKRFCFQRHIAHLKPDHQQINAAYLFGALVSPLAQNQIESKVRGVAQKTLNLKDLKEIEIPLPPIELQNQFAAIVEKVESLKNHYQKNLTELENLYGTLSQKAFKGELDLSRIPLNPERRLG